MRIALGILLLMSFSQGKASPLQVQRRGTEWRSEPTHVVLATEDYLLTRAADAKDDDFQDLYWIDLSDSRFDALTLESLGHVELIVPEAFAVVRIAPSQVPYAGSFLHDERWSCGQLIRLSGDEVPNLRASKPAQPSIALTQKLPRLSALHAEVRADRIEKTVESLAAMGSRAARLKDGGKVTQAMLELYKNLSAKRSDVSFSTVQHAGYAQPSYIVRIEGQVRPEEIVVFGSHIDSINRSGTNNAAPGADDNASGTASQLELFTLIMEENLHFDRTIEIHGYAIEELGLIGSQDIARRYTEAGKKVVAMVQNDMNLFKNTSEDMIWLVTNDTDPQLTKDAEAMIRSYQSVSLGKNRLTGGTSDHRSWNRQGVPVLFPTENPTDYNHRIHTAEDTVANSGAFTQAAEFVKLSLSFAAYYAGLRSE